MLDTFTQITKSQEIKLLVVLRQLPRFNIESGYKTMKKLAYLCIKFFVLALFGLAIAYVMSFGFGILYFAEILFPMVLESVWRLGLILICLIAIAMIIESFY